MLAFKFYKHELIYFSVKSEASVNTPPVSTSTTAPVSTGVSEGVVKQFRKELDSLKKEVESLNSLKTEVESLKSEYKKDIDILRQDLDKECNNITSLQVEIDHLKKSKGL